MLLIKAVRRDGQVAASWDPVKHPRDRGGRFLEAGGRVRLLDGTLATVTRPLGGNQVEVRRDDGRLEVSAATTVRVVKPGGAPRPARNAAVPHAAEDVALRTETLGLGEKFDHNGHTVSRTVNGYRVKLKSGEARTFDLPSQAGRAAHSGNLGDAPSAAAVVKRPPPVAPRRKSPPAGPAKPPGPAKPVTKQPTGGLKDGQAYKSVDEPFTRKDKDTANMYTVASAGINRPLRNGTAAEPRFKGFMRDMDGLFKRTLPTDHDMVAYRGTVSHVFPPNSAGMTYVDKGFVSLSTDGGNAAQYGPEGGTAVLEIFVPKGSKVMKPGSSSQFARDGVDHDQELVLNRGGRYEVTRDRMVGGVRRISVIYLPGSTAPGARVSESKAIPGAGAGLKDERFRYQPGDIQFVSQAAAASPGRAAKGRVTVSHPRGRPVVGMLMVKAVRRDGSHAGHWDPVKHPRDRHGRFIETGARVRLLDGTLATVTRSLGGGRVEVRRDDGRLEDTSAHTVQVVKPGEAEGAGGARLPRGRPLIVAHGPADTPVIGQVTGARDHLAVTTASGTVHYIPHQHVNRVYEAAHDGKPGRVHYTRPGFQPRPEGDVEEEITPVAARKLAESDHVLLPHPGTGRRETGTILRVHPLGTGTDDDVELDVRRADGTVDTTRIWRGEPVYKIDSPAAPDNFPGDLAGTPATARPPAAVKPLAEGTATARPVLYSYQRDMLTTLNLDRDRTLPDPVRQAAARLRQRQPLAADQASALASHLRYDASEASGVTPARKRALERTATRLDAAAAEIHGQPPPRPSPLIAMARRVTPGDLTAGDTVAVQTSAGIITAKVHSTRTLMGGRIHEIDMEYGNGTRQVRAYTGRTPMWLLPDLPDDQPLPPANGPVAEHITPDRVRVGDTLQKGDGTAKVTAVKPESPLSARISFDDGDMFPYRSYDGGPSVIRVGRGAASAGQPWDTVMPAEHPERDVAPGDLHVGDRITHGQLAGTIEHLEAVTGDGRMPGVRIGLREDNSSMLSVSFYGGATETPITRLVKADANAGQRIEAARQARQEATRVAEIRESLDTMLRDALMGDLARLTITIGHPSDDLMRSTMSAEPARTYAQRAMNSMIIWVIPNDASMEVLVAARKEAGVRLEPALIAMVQRQRDNLLTSLANASTAFDPLDPNAAGKIADGRRRVADQFRDRPPAVDTGQVAAALAAAVTVMRAATPGGPLPAPEVPRLPDGASVRDRMAGYRAALPASSAAIGKQLVSRAMYAAPRLEDLEAGKAPAVEQAAIALPDRAADGGPGEVAMRHLDIVAAAGRDLDAELQRRLAARGHDAASAKGRHDELERLLAAKKGARDEYARAHGYDSYSALLRARWDPDRDRGKDAELNAVFRDAKDYPLVQELDRRIDEITADPAYSTKATADALRTTAMELLNEARPDRLGGHGATYRTATGSKSQLTEKGERVKSMRWAEQHYPRGWLEKYAAHAPKGYGLGFVQRGHYNDSKREIRQSSDATGKVTGAGKMGRVSVHEAGHAMEYSVPGIRALEDAYLWSRTSTGEIGSRQRDTRTWLGGAYRKDETSRADEFPDAYAGKDYPYPSGGTDGLSSAYELLTMGMESLMAGSTYLDDSFRQWLLGTLALVD